MHILNNATLYAMLLLCSFAAVLNICLSIYLFFYWCSITDTPPKYCYTWYNDCKLYSILLFQLFDSINNDWDCKKL